MVQFVFEDTYILDYYSFLLTFAAFIFQKIIMTDPMPTNEMKKHAVIVALKADPDD